MRTGAAPDGVIAAVLKPGSAGRAFAKVVARGAALSGRPYGLPVPPVPLPLRAQLHGADGLCLETRHDASAVLTNDPLRGRFSARGLP